MNEREFEIRIPDFVSPRFFQRLIGIGILLFVLVLVAATSTYVVNPGYRGVAVTLGKVDPQFRPEGFGLKLPIITRIYPMSVRQATRAMPAECYSSDLQQVNMQLNVLYRVPERSVVKIFQEYAGEPFDNLIAPRVQEALKEVAATQSAEQIVKNREKVKLRALEIARNKIGTNFLDVVDLVLYNIQLSPQLESAIEQKMIQEQEAEKAKFTKLKAEIEAETAVILAQGQAEAIQIRGKALAGNPEFIKLQIIESWNGRSPLVVGGGAGGAGANLLLSLEEWQKNLPPPRPVQRTTDNPIRVR